MRVRGVMREPGGAGARTRLVPCVEAGAVVYESLRSVDRAVLQRQLQRGATLRAKLWRCGVGGCVAAAPLTIEPPRARRMPFAGGAAAAWNGGVGACRVIHPPGTLAWSEGAGDVSCQRVRNRAGLSG